ncbi:MAG TPA: glycosyltransferase, partial [Polyangiaceae bacterium]|nr:glycosyltransferase [Polyangiaceae bacterium]
ALSVNSGKAEAVRRGMLHALAGGAHVVGYTDADASTPARELLRLLDALFAREADVVMGARVQLLGSAVRRRRSRHYLGRIFATAASVLLDLPVYDTQCGAKFFRDSPALRQALVAPFASRWAFDVELLGRLLTGSEGVAPVAREKFLEVPLSEWSDVAGSKLDASAMLKSGLELAAIGRELRRKRQRLGRG